MADDLKRVGLVFKADGTADFKKSIKEVNDVMRESGSEFRLAKSQWDDSTKSAEKMRDTQKYLAQSTQAYKDKVEILNTELEQLENAEEKNEAAIRKKKEQLNNTKAKLNEYEKSLEDIEKKLKGGKQKIEDYGRAVQKTADGMKDAGKKMTTHVTAPILGVGAAAVVTANEMDDAYDNIMVGTGATGDALEGLKKNFDNVYGEFPADSMDVSTAIADINTRFGFSGEKLERASEDYLKFAKINKVDVGEAIRLTSRAMSDAGIESDNYKEVLDQITVASQNSGIGVDKLTENLAKYGAPMRALGIDTKSSIALFAGWEKAGVNTEIAFSGMKKAIGTWGKEGKDAREEFSKTVAEIQNAPDIAEATAMAIEAFGQKAGPDLADAIQGGRFAIDDMLAAVEGSGGKVDEMWNGMNGDAEKMQVTFQNLKKVGAEFGQAILTTLRPVLDSVSQNMKAFNEWFQGLDDGTKRIIVIIGLVIAAVGPLLVVAGTVLGSVSKIIMFVSQIAPVVSTMIKVVKAGIAGLNAVIMANPIIAIVVAIIAIIVLLYTKCEWFRDGVNAIISAVVEFFMKLPETMKAIKDSVVAKFTEISDGAKEKFGAMKEVVSEKFGAFVDVAKSGMEAMKENIKGRLGNIQQAFNDNGGGIKGTVAAAIQGVKEYYKLGFDAINAITGGRLGDALNAVKEKMESIKNAFRDKINAGKEYISDGISKIKGLFNFNWSFPKLKMPHFSISGDFSLSPPRVPKLNVSWYAKGGILNKPTIFGQSGNTLLGGGEAGPEAVLPISKLLDYMRIANNESNRDLIEALGIIANVGLDKILLLLEKINNGQGRAVVLDTGTLVGELAPGINEELGDLSDRNRRI